MKLNLMVKWCRACALAVVVAGATCPGLAAAASESASATVLTLAEAIELALVNNPLMHAASARVDAASARAYQAGRWSNPELEFSAEDWPVSAGRGFSDAKQTVGVAQTLPFPGKKFLDKQMGRAGVELTEAERALRRAELVRGVKTGFFRVLASERLVAVSTELLAVAESSAATARKRVDAGAAALQEQLRAEVQWERARTELTEFERELALARQGLATLVGRAELDHARLAGALAEKPDQGLMHVVATDRLAKHPSLNAARASLDRAKLDQRRARLDPYPDVKVGVAGGRIGATDESIIQLGFSVSLPILDHGQGRKQEARANVEVADAEMRAVQQQLQREWAAALKRYRTAAEQVANYRERILPKATEALRLVKTGFEEGKFGFIDLLDTQRTTAEARLAYQQKLLEMNLAQAELEALLPPQTDQPTTAN